MYNNVKLILYFVFMMKKYFKRNENIVNGYLGI